MILSGGRRVVSMSVPVSLSIWLINALGLAMGIRCFPWRVFVLSVNVLYLTRLDSIQHTTTVIESIVTHVRNVGSYCICGHSWQGDFQEISRLKFVWHEFTRLIAPDVVCIVVLFGISWFFGIQTLFYSGRVCWKCGPWTLSWWWQPVRLRRVFACKVYQRCFSAANYRLLATSVSKGCLEPLKQIIIHKNTKKHTAHTIVSWPNPKQWEIVHTSNLIMIIRQSIYILSIITRKWINWNHMAPRIV